MGIKLKFAHSFYTLFTMANPPDIVQRITQHIQSFQRSKVQLGEPREVVMPAARVGDLIKHKSFWGALAGAVVGAMVNSAPYLLCGLLGPFGAAARIALTIGSLTNNDPTPSWADKAAKATEEFVNEIFDSPDGEIMLGNPNVLVNGKPIATALIPNSISCDNHALQMIAEGSETVFVAGKNVARKGDKTTCGAVIQNGSPNVFFGSGQGTYVEIKPEFTGFQRALLIGVEFIIPPTMLIRKGIGKSVAQVGKSLAMRGAYVGATVAGRAKNLYRKSVFQFRPKFTKDPIKVFNPKTAGNKQKANFGEINSARNMLIKRNNVGNPAKNYNLERIGNPPPRTLNDPIRKGIDGIYKNRTPPPSFIFNEAKYGSSNLNPKTKDGPQMSDSWISGSGRLQSQIKDRKMLREITQAIQKGDYEKVLSKIDDKGLVSNFRLDSNGRIIGNWP
ncbi:PAAR domain-containing protein [Peptostreptococcus porci]|uniref:PAAR domain-containing protein n=1 Tax=Peptostreptococcus porci TaxID=2652282 RepID=UPI002A90D35B|nr:PAAR domain-containing protein [Peptostreptococcus porci]MDY5435858.1 PAAR domain-containing protein [Peptostreptococcus porci]